MTSVPSSTDEYGEARGEHRWATFWISSSIVFVLMLLWSAASPLMSSPDEPAHVARAAAVVRGQITSTATPEHRGGGVVEVPRYVERAPGFLCYALKPAVPADCPSSSAVTGDEPTKTLTTAILNSPLYYAIVGWPTLFVSGSVAFSLMRVMSALVCALLLGTVFALIRQLRRSGWATLAAAAATTPMILFLSGTVNPNGMEACGAAALFTALVVTLRSRAGGRVVYERFVVIAVSTLLMINTRSISLVWLLLIVVLALIASRREVVVDVFRRPSAWITTAVTGCIVGVTLWWFLIPKNVIQVNHPPGVGDSWATGFTYTLQRTFEFGKGWIGIFGWLDTQAPTLTYLVWILVAGGLFSATLALSSARFRLVVVLWFAALILVPAIVQASLIHDWGIVWQGRYTLAIFVCLVLASGLALDASEHAPLSAPASRLRLTGLIALSIGHAAAFLWVLRRYVVGMDSPWSRMFTAPQWQPPLTWEVLCLVLVLALAGGIVAIHRPILRGPKPPSTAAADTRKREGHI